MSQKIYLPESYTERKKKADEIEMYEATDALYSERAKREKMADDLIKSMVTSWIRGVINGIAKDDPEMLRQIYRGMHNLYSQSDEKATDEIKRWLKSFIKQANG